MLAKAELEVLYARLERPVFNVVFRRVWNRDTAFDVTQETFVKLWSMRERVRMDTVEPLVFRIAINLASNRRRAARLWRWVGLDALVEHVDADTESKLDSGRLKVAVEALSPKLRDVILLCELSEMTIAQVAETLGIPAGTVASRRHAAIRRLREQLGDSHVPTT